MDYQIEQLMEHYTGQKSGQLLGRHNGFVVDIKL